MFEHGTRCICLASDTIAQTNMAVVAGAYQQRPKAIEPFFTIKALQTSRHGDNNETNVFVGF